MPSVSYNFTPAPGVAPILVVGYGATARPQSYSFPLRGTIAQVFVQAPGKPEVELTSIDISELSPFGFSSPPLSTPAGSGWNSNGYKYTIQIVVSPFPNGASGLYVVRVSYNVFVSSLQKYYTNQSGPGFYEAAFDVGAGVNWETPDGLSFVWPPGNNFSLGSINTDVNTTSILGTPARDTIIPFDFIFGVTL
jgi:hypothetical protein